ncbi:protein transport protein gos1 [Malassezia cuniculi]|uniref:Golgi SNAP receptor complex member 1 n=1 Tax=Malassezia cuniculi TaxID=948313 RepID=A0AAF0ESF5_9BASI|nr:protein transport protein gos1 [Malassezia cuniculi]
MWDDHARRARLLQSRLDARLAAYAQCAADTTDTYGHVAVDMTGNDHATLESEIEALLQEYAQVGAALATTLGDPLLPPSASQQHTVERHRELLAEFQREFYRARTGVHQALDRKRLLGTVKEDINAYRAAHASETQAYLAERGHIDNSHRMIDETLDQAYATRAEFRAQQDQLGNITRRMAGAAAQIPGMDRLITMITRRRRRDTVIIAVVIGICVTILLWTGMR